MYQEAMACMQTWSTMYCTWTFILVIYRYSVILVFIVYFFDFSCCYIRSTLLIFMYGVQGRYLRIGPVNVYTGMACCLSNRGNIHDIRSPVS